MTAPAGRKLCCLLLALAWLGTGCVSKSRYEAMKRERDVYASHYATLTEESLALADVALSMGEELAIRDQELAKLRQTQALHSFSLSPVRVSLTVYTRALSLALPPAIHARSKREARS